MDNLQTVLKFADHGIKNLARLHNIRHLLYGLYFAMLATFISIYLYHPPDQAVNPHNQIQYLPLIASIIGQLLVIMQLLISLQIRANHDGLSTLFHSVPFIKNMDRRMESIANRRILLPGWSPMKYPFSIGIIFMFAANFFLLCMFIYRFEQWDLLKWPADLLTLCRWYAYFLIFILPIIAFVYFLEVNKDLSSLK